VGSSMNDLGPMDRPLSTAARRFPADGVEPEAIKRNNPIEKKYS